jgi:hypothetical protein
MDGVYDILGYMTGDTLWTHQLLRAGRECKPWLLREYPQLATAKVEELDRQLKQAASPDRERVVNEWLTSQVAALGEVFIVEPIPQDDHDERDPVEELEEMVGANKVIRIDAP